MLMNDSLQRNFIFLSWLCKNCGSQHYKYVVVDSEREKHKDIPEIVIDRLMKWIMQGKRME